VTQRDIADPVFSDARNDADVVHIDDSLVEHLLSLSYEERIDAHELARELARDLMQAGKEYYARRNWCHTP
jgi:hypothetical protein